MRPIRIRAEGFSAYRSPVELDLGGIDFFSLSGATGSGKSSLVDAMIFALFGRVPRLGGNAVAPAITAGADRARVAFDFEVGDTEYTVVRLAARTASGGASVKEARLQEGEEVLADGADNVTEAVEGLLRLRFEDFTRTVVLPQGEFARFLTAPKAERQGLLRNLLGLDIYSTVRSLAKTRESVARDRSEAAKGRLEGLDLPDDDDLAAGRLRLSELTVLGDAIVEREKALSGLNGKSETLQAEVERLGKASDRLAHLEPPPRLEELDNDLAAARETLEQAMAELERSRTVLRGLEEKRREMPTAESLAGQREAYLKVEEIQARLEELGLEAARSAAAESRVNLETARERLAEVERLLQAARSAHSAHSLRSTLVVGEPCPVCDQKVSKLPGGALPAELGDLETSHHSALEAVSAASSLEEESRMDLARRETIHEGLDNQFSQLMDMLGDAPPPDELAVLEAELGVVTAELAGSTTRVESAGGAERRARSQLEELAESVRSVGRELMAGRQAVAELDPPIPESDDTIIQWKELMLWRDEAALRLEAERVEAIRGAEKARAEWAEARSALVDELESLGVPAREPFAVEAAREIQVARSAVEMSERALAEAVKLRELIETSDIEVAVANALAGHLQSNGFEQWLMVGAIADLVSGANGLLAELSDGGYSLHSDDAGSFSIVDHRNADEIRSVSTLSGGETFLVSLALALSLAETLAAAGGADLDAIILDEGFGTLDDESLDTVASVLEGLAGDGLMVGVITHVKELAARAPARFEVTRGSAGSKVSVRS